MSGRVKVLSILELIVKLISSLGGCKVSLVERGTTDPVVITLLIIVVGVVVLCRSVEIVANLRMLVVKRLLQMLRILKLRMIDVFLNWRETVSSHRQHLDLFLIRSAKSLLLASRKILLIYFGVRESVLPNIFRIGFRKLGVVICFKVGLSTFWHNNKITT
jgi:hypothetical protein